MPIFVLSYGYNAFRHFRFMGIFPQMELRFIEGVHSLCGYDRGIVFRLHGWDMRTDLDELNEQFRIGKWHFFDYVDEK